MLSISNLKIDCRWVLFNVVWIFWSILVFGLWLGIHSHCCSVRHTLSRAIGDPQWIRWTWLRVCHCDEWLTNWVAANVLLLACNVRWFVLVWIVFRLLLRFSRSCNVRELAWEKEGATSFATRPLPYSSSLVLLLLRAWGLGSLWG